ncbi:MAG: glutathione S-transferase [Kofleriaceae bacterium]|nr:glutathione S-transferase [Kofleriaceae bacterium]
MKLYGTVTSPFVRRVRVVASELNVDVDRIDTATDAGQLLLAKLNPIRKVPAAHIDGRTLFDSRVIIDWLTTTRGWGTLAPPRDHWREQNVLNAIDSAADAAISLFYLKRDGVAIEGSPFELRQTARVASIFAWLSTEVCTDQSSFRSSGEFGMPELSLICMLDWLDFRAAYPTHTAPALMQLRQTWQTRPSLSATHPARG